MKLYSQGDIEKTVSSLGVRHPRYYFSARASRFPQPVYQADNIKLFEEADAIEIAENILSRVRSQGSAYTTESLKELLEYNYEQKKTKKTKK